MGMEGHTECAVRGCSGKIAGADNLCRKHALPGMVVRTGNNTMVITAWYAERNNEYGLIYLNDYALGDLFSGAEGFAERLRKQGFVNVRAMTTEQELKTALDPRKHINRTPGAWAGPWQITYLWEEV
jgi:hypothetical protein